MSLKKYLITDPKYYRYDYFENDLRSAIERYEPDFILFRDKSTENYQNIAENFCSFIKKYPVKALLHSDYKLAKELECYGVHLTSSNFDDIEESKKLNLYTAVSTHSEIEISKAVELGADAVTYSPIFGKEKGEPKGVEELKRVINGWSSRIDIFALGGIITEKEVTQLKSIENLYGFASIRAFLPN